MEELKLEIQKLENQSFVLRTQRDTFRLQRNKAREQRDKNTLILHELKEKIKISQILFKKQINLFDEIENIDSLFKSYQYSKIEKKLKTIEQVGIQSPIIEIIKIRLNEKQQKNQELYVLCENFIKSSSTNLYLSEVFSFYLFVIFKLKSLEEVFTIILDNENKLNELSFIPVVKFFQRIYANQGNFSEYYIKRLSKCRVFIVENKLYNKNSFLFREYIKMNNMFNIDFSKNDIKVAKKLIDLENSELSKVNFIHIQNNMTLLGAKIDNELKHFSQKVINNILFNYNKEVSIERKNKKVLILFSGQVRGFLQARTNIRSTLKVDVDTIWSVWDNTGNRIPDNNTITHYERCFPTELCQYIERNELYGKELYNKFPFLMDMLQTTSYVTNDLILKKDILLNEKSNQVNNILVNIESEEYFDTKILETLPLPWRSQANQAKMFYMLYQSFSKANQKVNLNEYDLIIRARPDLDFEIDLDVLFDSKLDTTIYLDVVRKDDYGDRLAIGSPRSLAIYNNLWEYLENYIKGTEENLGCPNPSAHKMLSFYLHTCGLKVSKSLGIKTGEMKSNKYSKEEVYNEAIKYFEDKVVSDEENAFLKYLN